MIRRQRQHVTKVSHGFLVIAGGVLRIAQPEQHRGVVAAFWKPLGERQICGLRTGEIPCPEQRHGGVIVGLFSRGGHKIAPIDQYLLRLDRAQTFFQGLVQTLGVGQFLGQPGLFPRHLFILSTKSRHLVFQRVDLALQVQQGPGVGFGCALLCGVARLLLRLELFAQFVDSSARFVITKNGGLRVAKAGRQGQRQAPSPQPLNLARHHHL